MINPFSPNCEHITGLKVLKFFLGIAIAFRCSTEIRFTPYLYSRIGIANGSVSKYFGSAFGTHLDGFLDKPIVAYLCVLLLLISALFLILNYLNQIFLPIALLCFLILEGRNPSITDGGDNLTRITLIFLLLTIPSLVTNLNFASWLRRIGIVCIQIQVCILYFVSGFMKSYGEYWHNGTALYYISRVEEFSLPYFRDVFLNSYITTIATYSAMFFMILFPFAVVSRYRTLWILIGIGLHIGIGTFMGLVSFSLVMIGHELLFITDLEYKKIDLFLRQIISTFNSNFRSFLKKFSKSE